MKKYLLDISFYIGLAGILVGLVLFPLPTQPRISAVIIFLAGIAFMLAGWLPTVYAKHPAQWLLIVHRLDLWLIAVATFVYLIVSLVMIFGLHPYNPQNSIQVAIVPGCKADNGFPSLMLQGRLDTAYTFLKANPQAICIVCGGQGFDEIEPEAYSMEKYLVRKGIDSNRILMDTTSTRTIENIQNAKKIMNMHNLDSNAVIVTNTFHQYRTQLYAAQCGLTTTALSCPTRIDLAITSWIREVPGIVLIWVQEVTSR